MSTLLHIDSRPLYGRSVSRELTAAFVAQWKALHPDGRVIDRDLNATAMPPINAEWVGAVYTPEQAPTPQQKELLSLSDSLLAELEQADECVIGVSMHNLTLRAYGTIDPELVFTRATSLQKALRNAGMDSPSSLADSFHV
jgi:FMN-dependent NADH-azoreductase